LSTCSEQGTILQVFQYITNDHLTKQCSMQILCLEVKPIYTIQSVAMQWRKDSSPNAWLSRSGNYSKTHVFKFLNTYRWNIPLST